MSIRKTIYIVTITTIDWQNSGFQNLQKLKKIDTSLWLFKFSFSLNFMIYFIISEGFLT